MAAKEGHPNADLLVGYPTAASTTTITTKNMTFYIIV